LSDIVEASYDHIAEWYNIRRHLWSNKKELEDFVRRLPDGARVLDAGCGPGYASSYLSKRGFAATGIDISRRMLAIAERKAPQATFLRMDMRSMDFPSKSFDGIVCLYAIIHVPRRSHRRILSRFRKFLKPNGLLLICTGWGDYVGVEDDWAVAGTKMYWSHFDKETNLKMIKQVGFRIIWSRPSRKHDGTHLFVLAKRPSVGGRTRGTDQLHRHHAVSEAEFSIQRDCRPIRVPDSQLDVGHSFGLDPVQARPEQLLAYATPPVAWLDI
jgi:SAM-dependent methyltransferase